MNGKYGTLEGVDPLDMSKIDMEGNGSRAIKPLRTVVLDDLSAEYFLVKAIETQKSPTEIIGEIVRERLAASL